MVYVISKDSKPLMPCSNAVARLLLKQGKANNPLQLNLIMILRIIHKI